MLRLTIEQAEALERVEQGMLQRRVARHLTEQWPAMADRLGPRLPAFVEFTMSAAERRGVRIALGALRYVNLCFVWGSGFEDKPGFEWAHALLVDPRTHEWQKMHQLVRRSVERLAGRTDGLPAPESLAQADARLTQVFAGLGMFGRLLLREGVELPLQPCDLDLVAIRVTDGGAVFEYTLSQAGPDRVPALAVPPPQRVDTAHPAWPARIHVIARAAAVGVPPTRLQLRTAMHAACDAGWHPHVAFAGAHGVWEWHGGEAKAISFPLLAPTQTSAEPLLSAAIAEETGPEISRLQLTTCSLREQGLPLGSGSMQVWTYPASQWLLQLQRSPPEVMHWPQQNTAQGNTKVRFECDGTPLDGVGWKAGFEALDTQVQSALARLGAAWERTLGLEKAQLDATVGMLCGNGALAWGWRQGGSELTAPVSMQLQAQLDLRALAIDLQCTGELRMVGAIAMLHLRANGDAALRVQIAQSLATPMPSEAMAGAVCRFSMPFALELNAVVTADTVVMNVQGPCTGALVGEAGLRPRLGGGSGWQWYAQLRIEPVSIDIVLHDPLLGQTRQSLTLLPAMPLLSWSLG